MISAMSPPPKEFIIDSWDDLLIRDDIDKIVAFNLKTFFGAYNDLLSEAKDIYFPHGIYREKLKPKLEVLPIDYAMNLTKTETLMKKASEGK